MSLLLFPIPKALKLPGSIHTVTNAYLVGNQSPASSAIFTELHRKVRTLLIGHAPEHQHLSLEATSPPAQFIYSAHRNHDLLGSSCRVRVL